MFSISDSFPLKCMVYFENKTRNHAKGFHIQKHLLPANESCVLILQNCCATDFRKTVIRFIACQVPAAFLHANSECPGAWPLSSRSRGAPPPYGACRRTASTAKHRGARAKTAKACDRPAHTTKHSAHRLPPHKSRLSAKRPHDLPKYVLP